MMIGAQLCKWSKRQSYGTVTKDGVWLCQFFLSSMFVACDRAAYSLTHAHLRLRGAYHRFIHAFFYIPITAAPTDKKAASAEPHCLGMLKDASGLCGSNMITFLGHGAENIRHTSTNTFKRSIHASFFFFQRLPLT